LITETWPWAALVGLGAFHGVNPAMGWLFAAALGLHRRSRRTVLVSLAPIALGHAAAAALVVATVLLLGRALDQSLVQRLAGAALIAWAAWHALYGHRRPVRVGMQTGLVGLALWSFLAAGAHGAGLMLIPAVGALCGPNVGSNVTWLALAGLAVHTLAMLTVILAIALAVYEWVGVAVLRRGWINFDALWTMALVVSGTILLVR
jgi:hypothetical protein